MYLFRYFFSLKVNVKSVRCWGLFPGRQTPLLYSVLENSHTSIYSIQLCACVYYLTDHLTVKKIIAMRTRDSATMGQNNTNQNVKKWLCGLTFTSWSSQWERFRDLTLLMSGMLRWIPEQSRQMNTPREQEPHPGSSEKKEERTSWIVKIQGYEEITFGGYEGAHGRIERWRS